MQNEFACIPLLESVRETDSSGSSEAVAHAVQSA